MKGQKLIKALAAFIMVTGILFSSAVYAAQPQIIIFCANWNIKCRQAKKVCRVVAQQENLKYTELDVDNPSTQQKAMDLGVSYPTIPFIFYINKNGKVVNGMPYRGESPQELKKQLIY